MSGCERERRDLAPAVPSARPVTAPPQSSLIAGAPPIEGSPLAPDMPGYAETAYAVAQGLSARDDHIRAAPPPSLQHHEVPLPSEVAR